LDEQLVKLKATINKHVERINTLAKEKGIELLSIGKNPVLN
jgi:hypothetical protein